MSDLHYVYRCYDKAGALLYVGCSRDVTKRMRQHRYYSPWYGNVARITQERCESEAEGLAREREVIVNERPAHNVTHALVKNRVPGSGSDEMRETLYRAHSLADFISLAEAARKYGIAYSTLTNQARRGVLVACRAGGFAWFTTYAELNRYISERKGKHGNRKPKEPTDAN